MRTIARWTLAGALVFAGAAHLVAPGPFLLLVPSWVPWPAAVVLVTGLMEVMLGVALVLAPAGSTRRITGWAVAAFLIVVFVGNVSQAVSGADAFGLDTDVERWGRLVFQPLLIAWALWSTRGYRGRGAGLALDGDRLCHARSLFLMGPRRGC